MFDHATQVFSRRPSMPRLTRDGHHHHHPHPHHHASTTHLRKISTASTSSTVSSASTAVSSAGPEIDPLSQHPLTISALPPPPRLSERPIIHTGGSGGGGAVATAHAHIFAAAARHGHDNYYDEVEVGTDRHHLHQHHRRSHWEDVLDSLPAPPVDSPRHTIHTSTPASGGGSGVGGAAAATDYFLLRVPAPARPELPRSHWSASTIGTPGTQSSSSTLTSGTPTPSVPAEGEAAATASAVSRSEIRNFSYKAAAAATPAAGSPRRPQMKGADSIENFIKRGGWKRRGIVFQQRDSNAAEDESSSSSSE